MAPSNDTEKTEEAKAGTNVGVENDEAAVTRGVEETIVKWNVLSQHYYFHRWKQDPCQKCQTAEEFINHKRNCDLPECDDCTLYEKVVRYHKNTCQIGKGRKDNPCQFCKVDGPGHVVNPRITRTTAHPSRLYDETIVFEITKTTGASLEGQKFIEGQDYTLGEIIASGGFGVVYAVKLLPAGKEKLGIDCSDHLMAAKMATVTCNEVRVLKRLADLKVPYVASHYFIVYKPQVKPWRNRQTGKTEQKVFNHLIFMKRAEMSLKDLRSKFPGHVLPLDKACYYFSQILHCVLRSHEAFIVHHDIKSSNILMVRDGDGYRACLADYEFAFHMQETVLDARRGGTKLFQHPEVVDGPPDDVHSLGMLFLEMTIPGALDHGKGCCPWPEYKAKKLEELKNKHAGLGHLIGACVKENWRERPNIQYVKSKFMEYAGLQRPRSPESPWHEST